MVIELNGAILQIISRGFIELHFFSWGNWLWPESDSYSLQTVELGEVVGIIAGQSIGEPSTHLTLRTFHIGKYPKGGTAEHLQCSPF